MEAQTLLSLFDQTTASSEQIALMLGLLKEIYAYLGPHRTCCSVLVEVSATLGSPAFDLGIVFRDPSLAGSNAWFLHQDQRSVRFSQVTRRMLDPRMCQVIFQHGDRVDIMREHQNRGITPETVYGLTRENLRKTAEAFVDCFFGGKPDLVEKLNQST